MIDQQRKLLEPGATVRQILAEGGDWIDVRGVRKHVMAYLKDFLFDPGLVDTKVGILSGGERSRLLLAREFARTANLLVLDEPTNDLDLETLDLLQEVIADFDGTVLIVSHDRDFLDRTVTVTLGLDGSGKVDIIAGGYADWEAKRKQGPNPGQAGSNLKQARPNGGQDEASKGVPAKAGAPVKLSYKDQRDYEILPARIDELETAIAKGEALLADPELYSKEPQRFATISQGIANARAEKDAAEERWLMLAEQVEG
jgi:ATP-binding cassette subfamily F protein uup